MYTLVVRVWSSYSTFSHEITYPPTDSISQLREQAHRHRNSFFSDLFVDVGRVRNHFHSFMRRHNV
jgi:hypothetical protein